MEEIFNIPKLRRGHKLNLVDRTCYWFEMDHENESPRTLLEIFDLYLNRYKWDRYIKSGSTVIDIGGHSGDTAIPMQTIAGGTVLTIEPNPVINPYLKFACALNSHLGKFIVAGEAVTTADIDAVDIFDHNNNLCNGGMIDPSWSDELKRTMALKSARYVTVKGMTLEHICEKYLSKEEIENIGFIKIDTEGHDISILESSQSLIQRLKPVLFIEWFFAYTEKENQHMFQVIKDLGYRAFDPETLEESNINKRTEDLLLIHNTKLKDYI